MKWPQTPVRISRNKLGYYSGLAVVSNDVAAALGNGVSVGKERGRERVPGEWDWGGGEGRGRWWGGGSGAPVMLGYGSSAHAG